MSENMCITIVTINSSVNANTYRYPPTKVTTDKKSRYKNKDTCFVPPNQLVKSIGVRKDRMNIAQVAIKNMFPISFLFFLRKIPASIAVVD